ncbi:MAG: SpoIIE family protein phosphatase, partial [Bacteroidota bacterium]
LLDLYQNTFIRLVNTEKEIGFNNDSGLRKGLNAISLDIEKSIADINEIILNKINYIRGQNRLILTITVVISILLIIFLAFLITRILSKPVQTLSKSINQVIQSNFSRKVDFNIIPNRDEIGGLSRDFAYMLARMQDSLDEIRSKSEKIEKKQKQLMDSIQYAQKIQQAILPDVLEMSECFEDHFVIYYPMHVVSGDFYWLTRLGDDIFFAVVDCTGHGVPGAFMSMIGHTLLNEIINEKGIRDPSLVLEMLDAEVRASLRQGQNRNQDGMEVALCRVEGLIKSQASIHITFAGAKGSLFYSNQQDVERLRGTRRGIGGLNPIDPDHLEHFENVEIHLSKGDSIYLGSDGFVDQPNHKRKSFGNKRLRKYLSEIKHLGMSTQKKILTDALYEHMGKKATLRDDVTLVGLRF